MIFHDAHQSGFHGVSEIQRKVMNRQIVECSTVAAMTEQTGLEFFGDGWKSHGSESRVVWDSHAWQLLDSGNAMIETSPWTRGVGHRVHVWVPWVVLHHRASGFTLLRGVMHLPAHLFSRAQRIANEQALSRLESAIAPVIRGHHPDETTLSGDFNRELTLGRNQDRITGAVKGLGMRLVVPPRPTLKVRRIDGFLTTARRPRPMPELRMLDRVTGYDHRGFRRFAER